MARKLKLPGNEAAASTRADKSAELGEGKDLPIEFEVQKVVDVADARETGEQVLVPLEPLQPAEARVTGQIAEVELDGGIKLWMRVGSLYRDFGVRRARAATPSPEDEVWAIAPDVVKPPIARGDARDADRQTAIRRVTIYKWQRSEPASPQIVPIPPGRESRGLAKDLLEGAVEEGLSGLAAGFVADRIADKVGRTVEKFRHGDYPLGLYKLNLEGDFAPQAAKNFDPGDDAAPVLLFIHGTMSSFQGSFGSLWQTAAGASVRKDLARQYRHAYALQRYTLTESPIDNALQLARALPQGTRLHLVTHSRGGLVGDLLCLGQREPWTAPGASPFASDDKRIDAEYKRQEANLRELFVVLEAKQIQVERYVRVACPSRGTTLASRRLDRWLSIFKLLGDVVPAAGLPLKFLLALIAEHEDPSTLPGLEAQTPGSPLIRTLNLPQLKVRADLTVISGDTESGGFLGRIKELALDQFFDDESDIIVNTGAMYGGLVRVDGGRFHLERGAAVNHFAYFDNAASVRKLAEGLLRLDGSETGFQPISEAKQKEPIARAVLQRAAPGPRPAVFILPGIMGSHLSIDDKRIWLAIGRLMLGGLGDLELNGADVKADPYLEHYYEELAEYLAQTHEVVRFPYDWRRSVMEAGERLAVAIADKLDQLAGVDQPVRVIAHSIGGLVVRAMIARNGDVWRRMIAHPRSRFVMLGTPNGGSHEIVRLLTGRATALRNLALLDLRRGAGGLLKIISGFPGMLELLPIANNFECFEPQFWKDLRQNDEDTGFSWQPPNGSVLRQARHARQEIEKIALNTERALYVAGAAVATPIGFRLQTEFDYDGVRGHWQTLAFEANGLGDGQVPWQTGIPAGVKAWYLDDVAHGELPAHAPAFPAYAELLETGNTSRLSVTRPAGARTSAASPTFDMPLELPPNLPDERDLAASAVGGRPPRRMRAPLRLPKAKVSVTHGDLVFARYPVAVGHYRGDTIVSAEAYLDRALSTINCAIAAGSTFIRGRSEPSTCFCKPTVIRNPAAPSSSAWDRSANFPLAVSLRVSPARL